MSTAPQHDYRQQALRLAAETGITQVVVVPTVFIGLFDGDLNAALLLNQHLYWMDRTSDPDGWFYKSYREWEQETGLTEYQVKRAIHGDRRSTKTRRTLRDVGVEVKLKRAPTGSPTIHYRLDLSVFFAALTDYLESCQPCSDSNANNVQDGPPTMPVVDPEQPSGSSLTENPSQTESEISSSPDDDSKNPFAPYEIRFGRLKPETRSKLDAFVTQLGEAQVCEVLERCRSRGRTWGYALKALANEEPRKLPPSPTYTLATRPRRPVATHPPVVDYEPEDPAHTPLENAWRITRNQLRDQLTPVTFHCQFAGVELVGREEDTIVFSVPDENTQFRCQRFSGSITRLMNLWLEKDAQGVRFTLPAAG